MKLPEPLPLLGAFDATLWLKGHRLGMSYVDEPPPCRFKAERDELLAALKDLEKQATSTEIALMTSGAGTAFPSKSLRAARALIARIEGK